MRFLASNRLAQRALGVALGLSVVTSMCVGFAASLAVSTVRLTEYQVASTIAVSTCSIDPIADSWVDENQSGSNFGNSSDFRVRSSAGSSRAYSFVRFNVAGCGIPGNASVQSATLSAFMFDAPSNNRTYDVARASSAWNEGTITWNNRPGVAATSASTTTGTTNNVTLSWNVLTDVQGYVGGTLTNNGWRISDRINDSTREARFRSDEAAANRPTLTITYYP
jgi:hypothetical protein